jgi:adenylate cyclase
MGRREGEGCTEVVRVERTFAFLDLCGFTAYTDASGDDAAIAVLADLRATLRAAAERRGVRIAKWLGDGAMISGVEAGPMLECAEAVRDTVTASGPLALRGGIASGHAVVFEGDDYVGAAVNMAARLCDQARPGELLVAAPVFEGLPERPGAEVARMRVAGVSRAVSVHRLPSRSFPEAA